MHTYMLWQGMIDSIPTVDDLFKQIIEVGVCVRDYLCVCACIDIYAHT